MLNVQVYHPLKQGTMGSTKTLVSDITSSSSYGSATFIASTSRYGKSCVFQREYGVVDTPQNNNDIFRTSDGRQDEALGPPNWRLESWATNGMALHRSNAPTSESLAKHR